MYRPVKDDYNGSQYIAVMYRTTEKQEFRMFKTYITLSRAGHYTVSIHNAQPQCIFTKRLISNLATARHIAAEFIKAAQEA